MFKLFNIFRKKQEEITPIQPPPKLILEPTSSFYRWDITELKPNRDIEWFDLLEYGVVKQIEGNIATIYYVSSSNSWENLYGREAIVLVCLKKKEILHYDLIAMN
ncbi:MAG: hypothetical protein ACPG45_11415 [Flavobacteriaceae bacterium]